MIYNYTDKEKQRIKANPTNRENARFIEEKVRYAEKDLHYAPKQAKERAAKIEAARGVLAERTNKMNLYKEIFPEMFISTATNRKY